MMKLFKNILVYGVLILLVLEALVRIFHLHNDMPERYVAEDGMLKWIPGQNGYTVYGNRRQNFAEYHINNSGYNSYREFKPSESKTEVAIIGDSYIEGFHQNYYNSIGRQIENQLGNGVEVYEYGHSSNDLADQLYTIYSNPEKFSKVDYVILYMKYENDLQRSQYEFIKREPFFPFLRHSKLVVYLLNIGILDPVKNIHHKINLLRNGMFNSNKDQKLNSNKAKLDKDSLYLENFKSLVSKYGFDKNKTAILLDAGVTNTVFLDYLKKDSINIIDFSAPFEKAGGLRKTTLIYDHHWNKTGRKIIAEQISDYLATHLKVK